MEAAVDQCFVDKNVFEIQIKQLRIDNDQLLNQIMSQEIVHIVANYVDILDVKKSCVNNCNKCLEIKIELLKKKDFIEKEAYDKLVKTKSQEKDTVIRKLEGKNQIFEWKRISKENVKKDIDEIETISIKLEHRMFKLDIEPISPRLKNNRDAHNELLVYVSQTCPSSPKPSGKLVAVTPINKDKRVRFTEPVTSSSNTPKQINSLKTKYSNKPLLTSTGVKFTIKASGSKPSGNTKNNRITRPLHSN
ncbi:hypothetical protein Tco_0586490 [Tanacetum coccineum]